MPKFHASKRPQARHAARPNTANLKAAKRQEPFADVAQRLGDALATVLEHDDCPAEVADIICELNTAVFNRHSDVAISLRHGFAPRLVAMLEQQ